MPIHTWRREYNPIWNIWREINTSWLVTGPVDDFGDVIDYTPFMFEQVLFIYRDIGY